MACLRSQELLRLAMRNNACVPNSLLSRGAWGRMSSSAPSPATLYSFIATVMIPKFHHELRYEKPRSHVLGANEDV